MNINDDFSQRVLVHGPQIAWEGTLVDGVRIRRLELVAGHCDRTTNIVECAEKSAFSHHEHPCGEELLVLDGTFEDDYGVWPAGSYVRTPHGSSHAPHTETGCVVLVKLCQIASNDKSIVHTNINNLEYLEPSDRSGVTAASLFSNEHESVRAERWEPNAKVELVPESGAEIFIIKGSAIDHGDKLEAQSWLRVPVGGKISITAGPEGTLAWVKTNHLKHR